MSAQDRAQATAWILIIIASALLLTASVWLAMSHQTAMEKCQRSHSFDACSQMLNGG